MCAVTDSILDFIFVITNTFYVFLEISVMYLWFSIQLLVKTLLKLFVFIRCLPSSAWIIIIIKAAWYCHRNRHVEWNRIETPDINPQGYNQLNFDKKTKKNPWRKGSLFNKQCWENWIYKCWSMIQNPYLTFHKKKINSKWIKYLYLQPNTIKVLEKSITETLQNTAIGKDFLEKRHRHRQPKSK